MYFHFILYQSVYIWLICKLIDRVWNGYYYIMSRDMTKPTKWVCAQWRLRSAWASAQSDQSSLSAWRKLVSLATHWVHIEDSDQTGRMPRLIWVFAGRTLTLLVLSCCGSFKVSDWNFLQCYNNNFQYCIENPFAGKRLDAFKILMRTVL